MIKVTPLQFLIIISSPKHYLHVKFYWKISGLILCVIDFHGLSAVPSVTSFPEEIIQH